MCTSPISHNRTYPCIMPSSLSSTIYQKNTTPHKQIVAKIKVNIVTLPLSGGIFVASNEDVWCVNFRVNVIRSNAIVVCILLALRSELVT